MDNNVMSFGVAIKMGYNPSLYTYDPQEIPLSEFQAILDFKAWSKRIIAINCYFTIVEEQKRIVLTVYGNRKTGRYEVNGSSIDFTTCPTGKSYWIGIGNNGQGNIMIQKVVYPF